MNHGNRFNWTAIQRKFRTGLVLCITVLFLIINSSPSTAQESNLNGNEIDGYPVVLDDQVLFRVRKGIPDVASAEERAEIVNNRLVEIAGDAELSPDEIKVEEQVNLSIIKAGDAVLFTIRDEDTEIDQTRQETAKRATQKIQSGIVQYREERSTKQITRGIILAILSTLVFILFIGILQSIVSRILVRIRAARRADSLDLMFQNYQVLDSTAVSYLLTGGLKLVRLGLILAGLYVYVPFILSQFPVTRPVGNSILDKIAQQTHQAFLSFVKYLPNVAVIALIIIITYYVVGFAHLVILDLGQSDTCPWFYPEWIQPTTRIVTFLIVAVTCILIGPYLPGADSPAFQGVSIFVGALLTLGSSSAVSNAISGIIVIYTRSFQIGDFIRVGETIGEVSEKSLFVTRIITPKQELITIPNSSMLDNNVINYSAIGRESNTHLTLHTTITLGYDVPWRTVHEVLIAAAAATSNILPEPKPFVLQTALNDFNVSYELNIYTDSPKLMPAIYSELHQNIQDYCNGAGIEILSPTFSALRDGNHSTIPSNYLPDDYVASGFQVGNKQG
ncbi:MAG: mechanosensitive ion channel family protein [Microcoleaceae cyanobacterium]